MADETRFDWDEANLGHIARHNVVPEEAQQVLANDPLELGSRYVDGEERFRSVGPPNSGRWILVVSTEREEKIRVITAYDADKRHVELYVRKTGNGRYESTDPTF